MDEKKSLKGVCQALGEQQLSEEAAAMHSAFVEFYRGLLNHSRFKETPSAERSPCRMCLPQCMSRLEDSFQRGSH